MTPSDFEAWLQKSVKPPLMMGILNATPDSFSDGGEFESADAAVAHGLKMLDDGASLIDVGGESTRPGSQPVSAEEQVRRTCPVVERLAKAGATISIDTTSAAVAVRAIDAGATLVNDVSAGRFDADMLPLVARTGTAVVLMHMLGTPQTMQQAPAYGDVVGEVETFLASRAKIAMQNGVASHRVLLDVGIGFGKTLAHNLSLLNAHARFTGLGHPLVLGTSRKGFIGTITGRAVASERVMGTAATIAWGIANGAAILRVHDVREMREVRDMIEAIRGAGTA